ncbi:MAG: hypothetical protein ACOYD9_03950 [Pyramidobacter sp.]
MSAASEAAAAAALHGNFVNSMKVEQAGLYRELLQVEGLSRKEAALLARVGGAINGYIEVGNFSTVLSLVPGMGAVGEKFASILKAKGGAKALLAVPSVRRTLLDGLKNYASGVGSETMEEIEQEAVATVFVKVANLAKGQDGKSLEEALSDILDAGREALPHMALGMLPGAVINTGMAATSTYRANRAAEGAKKGDVNTTLADLHLTPVEKARVNAVKELEASEAKVKGAETKAGTKAEAPAVSAAQEGNTEGVKADAALERAVETPQAMEAEGVTAENALAAGEGDTGDGLLFIKANTLDAYMQSLPEPERETLGQALGQALGLHKTSTEEYLLHAKDYEKAARSFRAGWTRRGCCTIARRRWRSWLTSLRATLRRRLWILSRWGFRRARLSSILKFTSGWWGNTARKWRATRSALSGTAWWARRETASRLSCWGATSKSWRRGRFRRRTGRGSRPTWRTTNGNRRFSKVWSPTAFWPISARTRGSCWGSRFRGFGRG